MKLQLVKATTSKLLSVFIYDSSVTTGAGLTGLVFNSAGLSCYYYREGQGTGATSVTLATMTIGTWATGGFVEIDATNMPGWYEVGIPDAVLATGVDSVGVQLKGATNMAPVNLEIQLTDIDLHDGVRGAMTALPNAAADAAGGLAISDAGGLDIDATDASVAVIAGQTTTTGVKVNQGTGTNQLSFTSGILNVNTVQVSGDTSAADNLEAMYDGTGYVGGTIKLGTDMVAISGDSVAADNLESYCDGTTPQPVNATQISGDGTAADNLELMYDGTGYAGGTTALNVNVAGMDADTVDASALAGDAVTEITDDIMAEIIETEGSYTVQQALSILLAVLAGVTSSSGNTLKTPNGVGTRVAATTNASNERTAMTLTPSS